LSSIGRHRVLRWKEAADDGDVLEDSSCATKAYRLAQMRTHENTLAKKVNTARTSAAFWSWNRGQQCGTTQQLNDQGNPSTRTG